jgi:hypothetical protein
MTDRGQTIHDYLLGIVVVLLTVAGVFAFFPDVFVPFEEPVDTDNQYMADQVADKLLDAQATTGGDRTVNLTALDRTLRNGTALGALLNRSGVPDWKLVNVTVQNSTGVVLRSETDDVGSVYRQGVSDPPATTIRVVQGRGDENCSDSCQVVVRVWGG